jgi:succinate dehydrogenase / fumarate reductase flavoprotein subunit
VAGPHAAQYVTNLEKGADALPQALYDREARRQQEIYETIYKQQGSENAYLLHKELGELMTNNVTVVRFNDKLKATDQKLLEIKERVKKVGIADQTRGVLNQTALFTRQLGEMLELARVITLGALRRDESRGAHYKPDFPKRDDAKFLKTTLARYTPSGPEFSWAEVDVSLIKPRERKYTSA